MAAIYVRERCLARAWEEAVLRCWGEGDEVATQYDKPGDPKSKDCAALIVVTEPNSEPMIHKSSPGSYGKMWEYAREVVDGIHDSWIDPKAGKWTYTYHQRFHRAGQFEAVIDQLVEAPHSRRALMNTWIPEEDILKPDPPCVQYSVYRVINGRLVSGTHIRSNDAFKASLWNMFAFVKQAERVSQLLSQRLGYEIPLGEMRWFADSFHVYGSYYGEFEKFLKSLNRPWEDRTISSKDPQVVECFESAENLIKQGILVT